MRRTERKNPLKSMQVKVSLEGAAFADALDAAAETARILRLIADRIERDEWSGKALDTNGNTAAWYGTEGSK